MSLTCCVDMSIQSPPIPFTLLDKSQMFSINPHARCYRCSSLIDKDSTFRASCHNVRKCMKWHESDIYGEFYAKNVIYTFFLMT